jgi:hypothetical protein
MENCKPNSLSLEADWLQCWCHCLAGCCDGVNLGPDPGGCSRCALLIVRQREGALAILDENVHEKSFLGVSFSLCFESAAGSRCVVAQFGL